MTYGQSADQASPGDATGDGRPARLSWPRRIGVVLLGILLIAWLAVGLVVELAGSIAIGDHSGNSAATLLVASLWLGGVVVITVIIAFVSRPTPS